MKNFLLNPPPELLDIIQFDKGIEDRGREKRMEIILPNLSMYNDVGGYNFLGPMIIAAARHLYKLESVKDLRKHLNVNLLFGPLIDALYNAAEHGNKLDPEKKLILGIWFGSKGILYGIKDESDFIGDNKTKIENRIIFKSTRKDNPGGAGMSKIYTTDKVVVHDNTLFLLLLIENLLKRCKVVDYIM